jgi:hypothetical protein
MLVGSGLSFQSCKSVPFAPVPATASKLEPRRPGYIGQRLRPLLISEIRIRGLGLRIHAFATQRWRYGSADTALRDRLDAFYVVGRQLRAGPGRGTAAGPFVAPARPRNRMSAADGGSAAL